MTRVTVPALASTALAALLLAATPALQAGAGQDAGAPDRASAQTAAARIAPQQVAMPYDTRGDGFAIAPGATTSTTTLLADGRALATVARCAPAGGCTVSAYDAESGVRLWTRRIELPGTSDGHLLRPVAAEVTPSAQVSPLYAPETDSLFVAVDGPEAPPVTYALAARTGAVQWVRQASAEPMVELGVDQGLSQ